MTNLNDDDPHGRERYRPAYPYLERTDVLATLEYAAAIAQEREVPLVRPT